MLHRDGCASGDAPGVKTQQRAAHIFGRADAAGCGTIGRRHVIRTFEHLHPSLVGGCVERALIAAGERAGPVNYAALLAWVYNEPLSGRDEELHDGASKDLPTEPVGPSTSVATEGFGQEVGDAFEKAGRGCSIVLQRQASTGPEKVREPFTRSAPLERNHAPERLGSAPEEGRSASEERGRRRLGARKASQLAEAIITARKEMMRKASAAEHTLEVAAVGETPRARSQPPAQAATPPESPKYTSQRYNVWSDASRQPKRAAKQRTRSPCGADVTDALVRARSTSAPRPDEPMSPKRASAVRRPCPWGADTTDAVETKMGAGTVSRATVSSGCSPLEAKLREVVPPAPLLQQAPQEVGTGGPPADSRVQMLLTEATAQSVQSAPDSWQMWLCMSIGQATVARRRDTPAEST